MELIFFQANKIQWGNLQIELGRQISQYLTCGKDFKIDFTEVDKTKTNRQLKGIHRLCQLLALRLSEINGIRYSLENAKDWVKWNFNFTRDSTEDEALAEAINERNKKTGSGIKLSRDEFLLMVRSFEKELKKPRSFATASKEEMIDLISKIQALGKKMEWPEICLLPDELRQLYE